MSSPATLCDVPVSTGFEGHFATCRVSLEWVVNSGLPTHNSQVSGLLTLPYDAGVMSMFLNNVPVAASLASDTVMVTLSLHGLPDTPAAPIELPHLRKLLVIDGAFLDSLILPELDELLIAADCLLIIPMLRRSQCHLRKLCLIRCSTTEGRAVLAGIPTLVELRWPATEKLLGRLIKYPSFLPELRAMWLLRFEDEQLPTVKLVTLMESRRTPPLSLRILNFLTTTKSDAMHATWRLSFGTKASTPNGSTAGPPYTCTQNTRTPILECGSFLRFGLLSRSEV
ncbi:hypothetical protein DFH09DRAFT_1355243 [Mycena vulgaris]|nr:hypothetical protein DFH09DRAFT_1355243 [Mycena vulgaris]